MTAEQPRFDRNAGPRERLIASLFSQKDEDGVLLETYITHIKIMEDGVDPTAVPPPGTSLRNPKVRYIVVAVKRNGKVRIHKSRANNNGTFSIGKTWNLEDLKSLQNHEGIGFTVSFQKSYYWAVDSQMEKNSFVSGIVRIYQKYTNGKSPELIDFSGISRTPQHMVSALPSQHRRGPPKPPESFNNYRGESPGHSPTASRRPSAKSLNPVSPSQRTEQPERRLSPKGRPITPLNPTDPNGTFGSSINGTKAPGRNTLSPPGGDFTLKSQVPDKKYSSHSIAPQRLSRPPGGSFREESKPPTSSPTNTPVGLTKTELDARPRNPSPKHLANQQGSHFHTQIQPPTPRDAYIPNKQLNTADTSLSPFSIQKSREKPNFPEDQALDPLEKQQQTRPGGVFVENQPLNAARTPSPANVDPLSESVPPHSTLPPTSIAITQYSHSRYSPSPIQSGSEKLFEGFSLQEDKPKDVGRERLGFELAPDTPLPLDSMPPPWMIRTGQTPLTSTFASSDIKPVDAQSKGELEHIEGKQEELSVEDDIPDPMFVSRYSMKPSYNLPHAITHPHSVLAESAELASQGATISRTKTLRERRKSKWTASTFEEESGDMLREVEDVLEGFDWTSMGNADRLEENLRNELMALEAANVHAIVEGDDRMAGLIEKLSSAIVECDKMDSLLTLYAVELSSLSEDISHIEGQNRGVQVQTANQKALKSELQALLETIVIPVDDIEALAGQQGSDDLDSIRDIEKILVKFYNAISIAEDNSEMNLASMRAVQERRDEYKVESTRFLNRMVNNLGMRFQFMNLAKRNSRNQDKSHPVVSQRDLLYTYLYRYSGLILYARMTHIDSYEKLSIKYIQPSQMLFNTETKDLVSAWRAAVRKITPEEAECVFTAAAEEKDNVVVEKVAAVRSATIKRSRTIRGKGKKPDTLDNSGSFCFKRVLDLLVPVITLEQNFIVDFFHMSSRDMRTFTDFVEDRVAEVYDAKDLHIKRHVEPDSQNAKAVAMIMERIFDTLPNELSGMVDQIIGQDPLQVVGILEAIEKHLVEWAGTDQDFLLRMLNRIHDRLLGIFERFLEEQLRSIEDTKLSIKRRGVVSFIRIFPLFVNRIESQLTQVRLGEQLLDIRETVDEAYQKINTSMFESLQAIAKASHSTNVDPEDKEQLYYHIIIMMNMHYYEVEIEGHGNPSLQEFDQRARDLWAEHLGIYIRSVIRRPLGKLLDFLEGAEAFARSNPGVDVSTHITFSRNAFRKLMSNYDHKEVKKGIEALYKRVDKHFGDEEESLQADLLPTVWKALREEYVSVTKRCDLLLRSYYADQEMDWNVTEVKNWFAKRAL